MRRQLYLSAFSSQIQLEFLACRLGKRGEGERPEAISVLALQYPRACPAGGREGRGRGGLWLHIANRRTARLKRLPDFGFAAEGERGGGRALCAAPSARALCSCFFEGGGRRERGPRVRLSSRWLPAAGMSLRPFRWGSGGGEKKKGEEDTPPPPLSSAATPPRRVVPFVCRDRRRKKGKGERSASPRDSSLWSNTSSLQDCLGLLMAHERKRKGEKKEGKGRATRGSDNSLIAKKSSSSMRRETGRERGEDRIILLHTELYCRTETSLSSYFETSRG